MGSVTVLDGDMIDGKRSLAIGVGAVLELGGIDDNAPSIDEGRSIVMMLVEVVVEGVRVRFIVLLLLVALAAAAAFRGVVMSLPRAVTLPLALVNGRGIETSCPGKGAGL